MGDFIYLSLIGILSIIIVLLKIYIRNIRKDHHSKLIRLNQMLSALSKTLEDLHGKTHLEGSIKALTDEARNKLNQDIFDLQMDVFKKMTKK